jgi:hypothetical protein
MPADVKALGLVALNRALNELSILRLPGVQYKFANIYVIACRIISDSKIQQAAAYPVSSVNYSMALDRIQLQQCLAFKRVL